MNIHGIMTIQEPDCQGEIIDVAGIDLSALEGGPLGLHLGDYGAANVAGRVLEVTKVDGTDPYRDAPNEIVERAIGSVDRLAGSPSCKPFVYVRAIVWHPQIMKALEGGVKLYYALGGKLLEKTMSQNGLVMTKTVLDEVTLTTRPVSKKLLVTIRRY